MPSSWRWRKRSGMISVSGSPTASCEVQPKFSSAARFQ